MPSQAVRVPVVDDSVSARSILTVILQSASDIQVVREAKDGRSAFELAQKLKPDLITMDIYMPVMDGFESTKHIMEHCPTPILVVTACKLAVEAHAGRIWVESESGVGSTFLFAVPSAPPPVDR